MAIVYDESGNANNTETGQAYQNWEEPPKPAPAPSPSTAPAPAPATSTGMLSPAAAPADPQQQMLNDWYASYIKSTPTAQGYTAAQAATTNWNVDPSQTVQGQLQNVINKGGPLAQQAVLRADQMSNRRGMLSSSMGTEAGMAALYGYAVPIATSDATMYGRAGETNANNANTTARFNTSETNTASRFGADANNQATAQQRDAGIRGGLQAQEQGWQSGENRAQREWGTSERVGGQEFTSRENMLGRDFTGAENQKNRDLTTTENSANRDWQTGERVAGQQFTAGENDENRFFTTSERVAGQQFTASQTAVQQAFQLQFQAADQAGKVALANIDGDIRKAVTEITGKYNVQMQTSSSMSGTFNAMNNGIAAILADDTLSWEAKQSAINALTTATQNAMDIQGQISGLDLGELSTVALGPGGDDGGDDAGVNDGAGGGNGSGGSGAGAADSANNGIGGVDGDGVGGTSSGGGSGGVGSNADGDAAGVGTGPMSAGQYDQYGNPIKRPT